MEKYGVETQQPGVKEGSSGDDEKKCPDCEKNLCHTANVPQCPDCGTKPFEGETDKK